jgi:hypothetical protein
VLTAESVDSQDLLINTEEADSKIGYSIHTHTHTHTHSLSLSLSLSLSPLSMNERKRLTSSEIKKMHC